MLPGGIAANIAECEVMIDQSRAIHNRRFTKALKKLPDQILAEMREKLRLLAEIEPAPTER